jgi:hypothetical protein
MKEFGSRQPAKTAFRTATVIEPKDDYPSTTYDHSHTTSPRPSSPFGQP